MKCFIVKHTLGQKSWYVVTQNGLELSTPLDSFAQATDFIRTYTGVQRLGCYRLGRDLTEVLISEQDFEAVSLKTGQIIPLPNRKLLFLDRSKHHFIGVSK